MRQPHLVTSVTLSSEVPHYKVQYIVCLFVCLFVCLLLHILHEVSCLQFVGVKVHEKVGVEKVEVENGRVCGVRTSRGNIKCEIFVNCGGLVSHHFDHCV